MKKTTIYSVLTALLLVTGLSGCASPAADEHVDSVVDIEKLAAITGVDNYQYTELEEADTIGGEFWSVTSAMFSIEFRIHPGAGMDLFEDYRTAANPDSRVWPESDLWDTCIYYEIGEYDGEIVAMVGEDCYAVSFVPSAYLQKDPVELGVELMELLIGSHMVSE